MSFDHHSSRLHSLHSSLLPSLCDASTPAASSSLLQLIPAPSSTTAASSSLLQLPALSCSLQLTLTASSTPTASSSLLQFTAHPWGPATLDSLTLGGRLVSSLLLELTVSAVNTVSLAYFKADPALFFTQLELECELRGITSQKTKFNLAVSKLPLEAVQEVREIIISPPKDKPYYKLKEELVWRTSMSRQKKLSQLLHEEQLGDSKSSQFLHHLQHLAGEGNEDGIIRHIFLQHLPSAYHAVLATVGKDASVEKLAKIVDNVADLTSGCTAPVSAIQTEEPDPLARLLEAQRRLEARMEDLERRL
ncbi:unnamed protein product [Acanthosepion pharaonis]|uniref:DUF7041 domain-containing protein n=1 Tax=Acanthosepion pharaonis TaxID=158019 RepID=A0A812E1I0_ACAPH|nr:unnamed protein product [Sepia pharaonis]